MPITERFVQNAVRDRLNKKYYRRKRVYEGTETYTQLKRADVLLAFMRAPNRPYTVVVEAKSRTTIGNLKLKKDKERRQRYSWAIALGLITLLLAITGYQYYFNAVNTLLLLLVFLVGTLLIGRIATWLDLWFTKSISAIEQLAGYPANESWIAIASDTFSKQNDYRNLYRQCRKNGVGLIVVNEKGRLKLVLKPKARHVFNNYLAKYGKKKDILAKISKSSDYGPTPTETRRTNKQLLAILLGLSFVGLNGLLVYEDQYGPVVPDPLEDPSWNFPEVYDVEGDENPIPHIPKPMPALMPCAQWPIQERSFIVLDLVTSSQTEAGERVKQLQAAGLESAYISAKCVRSWVNKQRFLVFVPQYHADRPTAVIALDNWKEKLNAADLPKKFSKVLKVKGR